MKIYTKSQTGIKREGVLNRESGVISYHDGELSHIVFEKHMGKEVHELKEPKVEPAKEETPAAPVEQSKPNEKKKPKTK